MKLPGIHLFEKKLKAQYFLAFILRDEKAVAVVFDEIAGKSKIIGKGEENFTKSIEEISDEEFLDVTDKAISKAEEVLPPGIETKKTIFGLKDEWIEDNKIKKEHLAKLKKLSDELGLIPIGFLQTSEAILNLLKNEEGAPVTAILAEFLRDFVIVSVVKAGKIVESKGAQVNETEALTVENLLKHFKALEILPSRILLFGNNSEKYQQQFLGHQWSKSLNFLHLPQAIALPDDLDVKGVLFGAASQLGFSVMADFVKNKTKEEMPKEEEKIAEEEENPEEENKEEKTTEEVEETKEEENPEEENKEDSETEVVSTQEEAFGFLEGADIAKTKVVKEEEEEEEPKEKEEKVEHALELEETEEEEEEEPYQKGTFASLGILSKTKSVLAPVFAFSSKSLSFLNFFKGRKTITLPLVVILLLIILYVVYVFTVKANVLLFLDAQTKEEKQTITFIEDGKTDAAKNEIAAEISSTTREGSSETKATGKKDTGTAAKGSVTVCSRFTEDKTLPSGTTITSSNNLLFVTDNSAKVASASADASADCTKATISVSAKQLGKEYNLPAGTKFTVGNYSASDIIAKNDDPFSGGTKKEITVISKEDLTKAQTNLIRSLQGEALDDLKGKISSDKVLLPELINAEIKDSTANKKVGDEASTLTLKGTVSYDGVVYAKSDLINFAKALFSDKLDKDQTLNDKSVAVDVENIKNENDQLVADVNFKVAFIPKIDSKTLAEKISGMGKNEAISYLSDLSQIKDVKININPPIPFLSNSLPKFSGNIRFEVKE